MKNLLTSLIEKINATLQPIKRVLSFNASGKGMAIGKVSEQDGLEVGWNSYFYKPVTIERDSNPWLGLKIGDKIAYIQVANDKIGIGYTWDKSVKIDPNGNLTGKYLTGTWLQTTAVTDLDSKPPKVAVLDGNGWVYSRTLEELRADLGINDYIVEQGTSGIWTYRKWNSGIAECWGHYSTTETNYTSFSSFYGYYGYCYFPENFFIAPPNIQYAGKCGTGFTIAALGGRQDSKDFFVWYLLSTQSGSTSIDIDIQVKGRWK